MSVWLVLGQSSVVVNGKWTSYIYWNQTCFWKGLQVKFYVFQGQVSNISWW